MVFRPSTTVGTPEASAGGQLESRPPGSRCVCWVQPGAGQATDCDAGVPPGLSQAAERQGRGVIEGDPAPG